MKTTDFILNGETVTIPNDKKVLEQIERFQKIEQYTRAQEKLIIRTAEQPSKKHPQKHDFIIQVETDKYKITAVNSAAPTPFLLLRSDSWHAMIHDKTNGTDILERGGVAKFYFELLKQLKDIQK